MLLYNSIRGVGSLSQGFQAKKVEFDRLVLSPPPALPLYSGRDAAGAEPSGQMRDEKLHDVVARSRFRSQKAKNISRPERFWELRCSKSARCCCAKHSPKSKCATHTRSRALLEVEMFKKCTPSWREAHFEAQNHVRTTFGRWDVEKVNAVVARKHISDSKCDNFWTPNRNTLHYTVTTTETYIVELRTPAMPAGFGGGTASERGKDRVFGCQPSCCCCCCCCCGCGGCCCCCGCGCGCCCCCCRCRSSCCRRCRHRHCRRCRRCRRHRRRLRRLRHRRRHQRRRCCRLRRRRHRRRHQRRRCCCFYRCCSCWPILRLCWPMPMRTKCWNLQHFALWDGKNQCKYHSFSPRKWLKHSYLQSFVHITIFDFLKTV